METSLAPCPFCGEKHDVVNIAPGLGFDDDGNPILGEYEEHIFLKNHDKNAYIPLKIWQSRPLEDALRTEVELIRDANENWKIQYDVLHRKLDIAVEAMVKATEAGSGFEKYEILMAALAEIEALKQLEG